MQNSYRLVRNAPHVSVVRTERAGDADRLAFGTCFFIWVGLIASTWATIAFIASLF